MKRRKGNRKAPLTRTGSERFREYSSSLDTDRSMLRHEVIASIAYVRSLAASKIVTGDEEEKLISGLRDLLKRVESGKEVLDPMLEDVHMNVEVLLTELVGDAAKKVHTGRSRNEQIAVDERLYLRERVAECMDGIVALEYVLLGIAGKESGTLMPGFTHMQAAQPITLGFWAVSHASRLSRDFDRFVQAYDRMNSSPLGAGAFAGSTVPHDRGLMASLLGFDSCVMNALDAVMDRDYLADICYACALTSIHLSNLCEDVILFASPGYRFVRLGKATTTGSSMMPQKQNPDAFELARGETGGAVASLIGLLTVLKSLPSGYNRDMQNDRTVSFGSIARFVSSLRVLSDALDEVEFDKERMRDLLKQGYMNATDLADYLVKKGMPFRDAYKRVAALVEICRRKKMSLSRVDLLRHFPQVDADVYRYISFEECVKRRSVDCGTAPGPVAAQAKALQAQVDSQEKALDKVRKDIATSECLLRGR
jgi:argininosuccinate lyase